VLDFAFMLGGWIYVPHAQRKHVFACFYHSPGQHDILLGIHVPDGRPLFLEGLWV